MSVTLHQGLASRHLDDAARLYWEAFRSKLGLVLGPDEQALRFIRRVIDDTHVISAVDEREDTLAGIIGLRTHLGTFVGGGWRDLIAVYGVWGAQWRMACFSILAFDNEHRAMMIDGLSVDARYRGIGIGRGLLEAAEADALARGFTHLRLDVVDENRAARTLYDKMGFRVVRQQRSQFTARIFGFESATVMIRDLRLPQTA